MPAELGSLADASPKPCCSQSLAEPSASASGRVTLGALQAVHPNAFTGFDRIRLDAFTVTLAATAALVIGGLTGAPAAIVDVAIDASSIATPASRATSGPGDRRLRDVLLVAQVAVAVVLLVAAGLLTRNAQRVLAKSPGFDVRNTLVVAADVSGKCYATSEARTVYVERLVSAVAAVPGVESAALTDARFRVGESVATLIEVEGRPKLPDATESAAMRYVSPESFGRCA